MGDDYWSNMYDLVAIEHPSGGWQLWASSKYPPDRMTGPIPDEYCVHEPGEYHATREEALACRKLAEAGSTPP